MRSPLTQLLNLKAPVPTGFRKYSAPALSTAFLLKMLA